MALIKTRGIKIKLANLLNWFGLIKNFILFILYSKPNTACTNPGCNCKEQKHNSNLYIYLWVYYIIWNRAKVYIKNNNWNTKNHYNQTSYCKIFFIQQVHWTRYWGNAGYNKRTNQKT